MILISKVLRCGKRQGRITQFYWPPTSLIHKWNKSFCSKVIVQTQTKIQQTNYSTDQTTTTTTVLWNLLFPGPPVWAGARRELLDFMMQGKINRGRHTDHPAGCHSIWTKQCPPPPSLPIFLQAGCPSCSPTNSVKALKATSEFGLGRRC